MVDVKKLALGGVFALISVFLFYTLGSAFIPTTSTSAQLMNSTLRDAGFTTQGTLTMTIFGIMMYAFALAPLGIAIYLIVDSIRG